MAEIAGLVISGGGLAALAETVIDNFERFEAGRNQGNDYKHYALQLSMAKLAYQRWLASVRIAGPANKSVPADLPVATEQETQAVKELLGAVQAAFTKAEKYTVHEEPQPVIAGGPGADDNLDQLAVSFKESAKKYQKSTNFVGRFRWVLHDSKALQTLTERVVQNVDTLARMFPATARKVQQELAVADAVDIAPSGDTARTELLQSETENVDPVLHETVTAALREGDRFLNMRTEGAAMALFAPDIAPGVTGSRRSVGVSTIIARRRTTRGHSTDLE